MLAPMLGIIKKVSGIVFMDLRAQIGCFWLLLLKKLNNSKKKKKKKENKMQEIRPNKDL